MRVSENQLKKIIRNVILAEGAAAPEQLGNEYILYVNDLGTRVWQFKLLGRVDLKDRFGHIDPNKLLKMRCFTLQIKRIIEKGGDTFFELVGELEMRKWNGFCNDAWEIYWAEVMDDYLGGGFGPLMYDVAMEIAGESGVMCDRNSVSNDAARVWNYYVKNRADVYTDDIDVSNCPSDMMSDSQRKEIESGGDSPWHQKIYYSTNLVAGGMTPVIDALDGNDSIVFNDYSKGKR